MISWTPALQNKGKYEGGHARIWQHATRMTFKDDLQDAKHMVTYIICFTFPTRTPPCGVVALFDLRYNILSHRNMWSGRACGVIALFDLRYHILSERNLWSDRACGVIALFDLRYHITCVTFSRTASWYEVGSIGQVITSLG